MKFQDIPQLTRIGSYQVNVGLKELKRHINGYLETGLQLCPDFQRGHVWTENQQIAYVEYLLKGGNSAKTIYLNQPGWMTNWKGDFVLVDGLQRITACLKFMNNELPVFGDNYYKEFEDKLSSIEPDLIINVNNLKTRKEVLQWYIDFNSGGTVHTEKDIQKVKDLLEKEINHG
jgi:uncharacterized protein with ParB-like and HNH nuclease domain